MSYSIRLIIFSSIILFGCSTSEKFPLKPSSSAGQCEECFPYERLPTYLQEKAKALFIHILDEEGLYTLIGDLKPYSNVGLPKSIMISESEIKELNHTFSCGEIKIEFYKNSSTLIHDGKTIAQSDQGARVMRTDLIEPLFKGHIDDLKKLGIQSSNPSVQEVVQILEDRNHPISEMSCRLYGLLFGYPAYAIEFFEEDFRYRLKTGGIENGQLLSRNFVDIPVFSGEKGHFIYATPATHKENGVDQKIKTKASKILKEYSTRRARYRTGDINQVFNLIRDWYTDRKGICSPKNTLN